MKKIFLLFFILLQIKTFAQPQPIVFTVTDSLPAIYEGLKAGYIITEQSEKEVGSKGNFSRYKIKFMVTNTGSEAKLFLQKSGIFNSGSAENYIAEFKCANATGARLTNKTANLQMNPCTIEATVEDKECGTDKTKKNRRFVDIGYWIKPNETITANTIMIVPLNEKPNMSVTFYPNNNGYVGNTNNNANNSTTGNNYTQAFVHLKNFASSNYINNQNGPVACTTIDYGWWSAQWEILPVSGTSNFQIRNRWKNNFISTENSTLLSDNGQNAKAMWMIEETSTSNIFYIKNAADNSKLIYQNSVLKTTSSYISSDAAAQWIIEK